MTTPRDQIWIDMTQFDTSLADAVWDGTAPVPDAPRWYDDVITLVHTARGPAEPGELIAEPLVVEKMHLTMGAGRVARHHRPRKALGRLLAMKAAAATTAGVVGVAAAAAATTGLVARVATVVVPVIKEHVVDGLVLSHEESPDVSASGRSAERSSSRTEGGSGCTVASAVYGGPCVFDLQPAEDGTTADAPGGATAEPDPAGMPPQDITVEPEAPATVAPDAAAPDAAALEVTDAAPAESPAPEALPEATPPADRPAATTPPKVPRANPSPATDTTPGPATDPRDTDPGRSTETDPAGTPPGGALTAPGGAVDRTAAVGRARAAAALG